MTTNSFESKLNPYPGAYPGYGHNNEWNWFDYLNQITDQNNQSSITTPGIAGAQPATQPLFYEDYSNKGNDNDYDGRIGVDIGDGQFSTGTSSVTGSMGLGDSRLGGPLGLVGAPGGVMGGALDSGIDAYNGVQGGTLSVPGTSMSYTNQLPGTVAGGFLNAILGAVPGAGFLGNYAANAAAQAMVDDMNGGGIGFGSTPGDTFTFDGSTFSGMVPEGMRGGSPQKRRLVDEMRARIEANKRTNPSALGSQQRNNYNAHAGKGGASPVGPDPAMGRGRYGFGSPARAEQNANQGRGGGGPGMPNAGSRLITDLQSAGPVPDDSGPSFEAYGPGDPSRMGGGYGSAGRNASDRRQGKGGYAHGGMVDSGYVDAGDLAGFARGGIIEQYADQGRGNDTELAHVTPGELMVPPEFQQEQPALMHKLYHAMMQAGLDPSEFTVGEESGANPDTGMPEYGFWKSVKKIGKKVLPVGLDAATSYFTGSDILGGLAAGASSKLFGNDWQTALMTGIGTGALSAMTGLSGTGPGLLGELLGNTGMSSMTGRAAQNATQGKGGLSPIGADPAMGGGSGIMNSLSGMGGKALDFIKENPMLAAGAIAALGAASSGKAPEAEVAGPPEGYNDPEYTDQIEGGGWELDREQITPTVDWYTYGQMPQFQYWDDVNAQAKPMAKGGKVARPPVGVMAGMASNPSLASHGGQAQGKGAGQDDLVPVNLSRDEYVIPADVVADLGDGSSGAGGERLNKFVKSVRSHKSTKNHPPKAKSVEAYL